MATKGSLGVLGLEEQTNAGPSVQSGGTIDSGTNQAVTQRGTITDFKSEEVNVEQSETVTPTTEKVNDEQKATPGVLGTGSYYADTAPLTSSWENKAEQQSGIKFQQDVLAGKQTMLRSAQEAQAKGQEMQTQLALGEYMRGQSAEKAGWTGGYMLDQKRQGDYLKASIQAQMYGAQELQRYGMDTQLEAARLAYDLGKEQLAYQLYQQEYQKSITEAQMFGYYVSPENRDLLNQLRASQAVLSDVNATEEEKARATVVKNQIDTWFGEQNLNPNDITKFAEITMEREQWNQAKLDAVLATINDDPSIFIARNPDGSYATDPATGQYLKLNFDDISSSDLATFLSRDDGDDISSTDLGTFLSRDDQSTGNKFADATFRSYAKYLAQSTINDYFSSLGEGVAPTAEGFKTFLSGPGADKLQAFRDKNSSLKTTIDDILADNFSPSLSRNGVTITYGRDGVTTPEAPGETPTTPTAPTVDPANPQSVFTSNKNPYDNTVIDYNQWVTRFNNFAEATNLNTTSFNVDKYAEEYAKFYNVGKSILNNEKIPLGESFENWAAKVHQSHALFAGNKNYTEFVNDQIKKQFKTLLGSDYNIKSEPVGVMSRSLGHQFRIEQKNLSSADIEKFKRLGFVEVANTTGMQRTITSYDLVLKFDFSGESSKQYKAGSGWNDKYGTKDPITTALYRLLTMNNRTDLTNTTEGEARWS
jgi:hypothetical protein